MAEVTHGGAGGNGPTTYFAPAERAAHDEVQRAAAAVSASPVMTATLQSVGGILLVLNRQRQIVAVNDELLRFLGCQEPDKLLGLRPGEALNCIHACDNPAGGCGTSEFCRTCGAAVAIVSSMREGAPTESECLLTAIVNGRQESFEFRVKASPIQMGGQPLLVISLQDIRDLKRREALEAVFLHDLMNTASALQYAVKSLSRCKETERAALEREIADLTQRLVAEISEQRDLTELEAGRFRIRMVHTSIAETREVLTHLYAHHPCAADKRLAFHCTEDALVVYTDPVLLTRALSNLVKNAFEATPPGGEVRVTCGRQDHSVVFEVWNEGQIPPEVASHIFVRYFSTKAQRGRGLGTYGVRLIVERYLGGRVSFSSSASDGTRFRIELPCTET